MTDSHKEIAARIVKDYSWDHALIEGAILAALHNERERCARIAEGYTVEPDPDETDPYDDYEMGMRSSARSITRAIRAS